VAAHLQSYLAELRSHLDLAPEASADVVRELEAHVEDAILDLEAGGLPADAAADRAIDRLGRPRALARQYVQAYTTTSWHDAAMAAAAFLLVGALYATHLWPWPPAVAGVAVVVVAVTLVGLWQGRPTWFYAWAGLALTLLSFCGYFAFVLLDGSADAIGQAHFRPVQMLGFGGGVLYFPLALSILASCIRAASRRDWLDASLMLTPSVPVAVWLFVLHQNGGIRDGSVVVPEADSALAATFLSMAVAAAIFVRLRSRTMKLATMLAASVFVVIAVSSAYDPDLTFSSLTGRSVLLLALLFSPALVEKLGVPTLKPR